MKKKLFIIFICVVQMNIIQGQTMGMFGQKVDVSKYRGKHFTLNANVKANLIDTDRKKGGSLWVRILKAKGIGAELYSNSAIRLNTWNSYSISGNINDSATFMIVGGLFDGRGIYSYDNFMLTVEQGNGNTIVVPLADNNFENDSIELKKSWAVRSLPKGFVIQKSDSNAYAGLHSLIIDGSKAAKENKVGDNDNTGKYATVNGIKLYYETYGEGEPLLLLHGNSQSISAFTEQVNFFSKKYKVIAVDSRGQGKSDEDGKKYSYDLFAEDMNALLDELKTDSVNIVGWSDGGNTGLILAMKYPKKVKCLITMGANIFINKSVVDSQIWNDVEEGIKRMEKETDYESKNSVRLLTMLLTEPKHTFKELKKVKCPVLIIAGEKDLIKEDHTKGIAKNIKQSQLYIAPNQTHYYPQENAKSFNEKVLNFLEEIK